MPEFKEGKLLDFFVFFNRDSPQNKEGARQLDAHIRRLEEKYKVAPEDRILRDEASWAVSYRKRPKPEPVSKYRQVNKATIELIKAFEGLELKAYKDAVGVWTIGYGHTGPDVSPGRQISSSEAEALLRKDLRRFEEAVAELVDVPLNDNQFGALVSLTYNIGEGALEKSTLLKKLNAKDYAGAANQFDVWVNGNNGPLPGLVTRRAKEKAVFLIPAKSAVTPPKAVSIEKQVKILAQDDGKACGQTAVAMAIRVAGGKAFGPQDIENKYGYGLMLALAKETPVGVRYRDAGNFTPELWDDIQDTLEQGLMPIIALNGPEFSPSGYGHIMGIVGLTATEVRLADPNGGYFRTVSRKTVEKAPDHTESGNFVLLAERY